MASGTLSKISVDFFVLLDWRRSTTTKNKIVIVIVKNFSGFFPRFLFLLMIQLPISIPINKMQRRTDNYFVNERPKGP